GLARAARRGFAVLRARGGGGGGRGDVGLEARVRLLRIVDALRLRERLGVVLAERLEGLRVPRLRPLPVLVAGLRRLVAVLALLRPDVAVLRARRRGWLRER